MKIESTSNPKFKIWKELLTTKGIKKHQQYILAGKKLFTEAKEKNLKPICRIGLENTDYLLTKALLKELSPNQTPEELWLMPLPEIKNWQIHDPIPENSIFLPIGDPSNLGATIRSAVAFQCENIILLKEAAHPFLAKSVKASSGAVWHANFYFGPSIQDLKSVAPQIYALDASGDSLSTKLDSNKAILVGEEGPGIPDFDFQKVAIPISTTVESLNASIAASIILYEISKQRNRR